MAFFASFFGLGGVPDNAAFRSFTLAPACAPNKKIRVQDVEKGEAQSLSCTGTRLSIKQSQFKSDALGENKVSDKGQVPSSAMTT
jgi:hypothetical protein